jgi:hypothetical protein
MDPPGRQRDWLDAMRTGPATHEEKAEKAVHYLRAIVAGEMHSVPTCSGLDADAVEALEAVEAVALALR